MSFESLPNRLGGIPNIYQYQNLPVRQPFPTAQVLAAIAGPVADSLVNLTPEARTKAALAKLELNLGQQKLDYIRKHPDAILGGKSVDPLLPERRANLIASTNAANALADQRTRGKPDTNKTFLDDPDYANLFKEAESKWWTPGASDSGTTGIPPLLLR